MGRALANFRDLAEQEVREPQMVQLLDKFEQEQSDVILRNLQSSMRFVRFVADVTYLFFPAMIDTVVGVSDSSTLPTDKGAKEEVSQTKSKDSFKGPATPDQGRSGNPPGVDGPDPV